MKRTGSNLPLQAICRKTSQRVQEMFIGNNLKNLADWLGPSAYPSTREERYLEYDIAKQISAKSMTKSQREWQAFVKSSGLPAGVPYAPNDVYKNKGWKDWRDWGGMNFLYL